MTPFTGTLQTIDRPPNKEIEANNQQLEGKILRAVSVGALPVCSLTTVRRSVPEPGRKC